MSASDESAVRAVIAGFVDAWNRHDTRTLACLFVEDADFVDVFGNWFKDRTTIEHALAQRHATVFTKSRFAEKEVVVRFHRPDLAIVHAVIELSGAVDRQGQALPPGLGVITFVLEKTNSGWQIIALQNTAVAPPQPPTP
jgi:uncharacterized protein (TIGR02246 family)